MQASKQAMKMALEIYWLYTKISLADEKGNRFNVFTGPQRYTRYIFVSNSECNYKPQGIFMLFRRLFRISSYETSCLFPSKSITQPIHFYKVDIYKLCFRFTGAFLCLNNDFINIILHLCW